MPSPNQECKGRFLPELATFGRLGGFPARSGRTMWIKAATHAERAKSGVLLEMSPNFLV